MQGVADLALVDAAREELEVVAASLARTPRLEQLMRYLAKRYFDDQTEELTEYNIATEVFGRKKTHFIASEDAIARVETHRLRKKLIAYYETEGRDHAVQISIPAGAYVPQFTERSHAGNVEGRADFQDLSSALAESKPEPLLPPATTEVTAATSAPLEVTQTPLRRKWSPLLIALALLVLAGLAVAIFRVTRNTASSGSVFNESGRSQSAPPQRAANGTASLPLPFRMIAGYSGPPQTDRAGELWEQDRFFEGGWPSRPSKAFIARTSDPLLFRYGRSGDSYYNIPLAPGKYELHLYFMQGSDTEQSEDLENKAIFNVHLNGAIALYNFDIVSDAMGRNTADERVFHDVSPDKDGILHIQLSTVLGTPSINAIQILQANASAKPLRLVMQPASFTDRDGQMWRSDDYFLGGRFLTHNLPQGTSSDVLPFERYGHFQYALPADPGDRYTVKLKFEELYFGSQNTNLDEHRLFRVLCNGETLLDNFEILKEAGSSQSLEKTFRHLKPSAQGKLNLDFEPISNYATVSSIELIDESR